MCARLLQYCTVIAKAKAHGGFPLDIFTRIFNVQCCLSLISVPIYAPIAALIGDSGGVSLQMSLQVIH